MKKVITIVLVAVMIATSALSVTISADAADFGPWDGARQCTGWWMVPNANGQTISIKFTAPNGFDGITAFYAVGEAIVRINLYDAAGNELESIDQEFAGNNVAETQFSKAYPAGEYTLKYTGIGGSSHFVLGSCEGNGFEVELIADGAITNPDTLAYPAVLFNGAEVAEEPDDEPADEPAENYVVDLNTFTDANKYGGDSTIKPSWPEAGFESAVFVQGYGGGIILGDVDLSKYSAVKITYSFDGGDGTAAQFDAVKDIAYIGLKSTETSFGQAGEVNTEGAIAYGTMVFSAGGWGDRRVCEIDLTDIDYNGAVNVTAHNPTGTQIAIANIEFVPAAAEPENPGSSDAAIVVVAAVAAIALAGVVVCKKVKA